MRTWMICVLSGFFLVTPVARPAEPAKADAAKQTEAQAKAQAEARALAVGRDYETRLAAFEQALKNDKLDEADAAARDMIRLSAEQGKPPWQPTPRTYANVIKAFEQKKVFGAKNTTAFYEKAIKAAKTANEKAELTLAHGLFLQTYALVDEAKAQAVIEAAFNIPDLTAQMKIQMCQKIAQNDNWALLDEYADKAIAFAGNEPALRFRVFQWMLGAYTRTRQTERIMPLCEKILADKAMAEFHVKAGAEMVKSLNTQKRFKEAQAYLEKKIPALKDAEKRSYQELLMQSHQLAAKRFYSDPEKEDVMLAIKVGREMIENYPTNHPNHPLDIADLRLKIADMACSIADYGTAATEAGMALATPDLAQKRGNTRFKAEFTLGKAAYEQGDYPGAVAALEPLVQSLKAASARPPFRRDAVEMLVRAYCAVGSFDKAIALSENLLELLRNHERKRYQIYLDGLQRRQK